MGMGVGVGSDRTRGTAFAAAAARTVVAALPPTAAENTGVGRRMVEPSRSCSSMTPIRATMPVRVGSRVRARRAAARAPSSSLFARRSRASAKLRS